MGGVPEPEYSIGLWTLLTLDDVKLNIIALFQSFVPIQLNCRIVDEYVWPVFTPDESVALGVVEPLNLTFVLSHRLPPSLHDVVKANEGVLAHGESFAAKRYDVRSAGKVDYDSRTCFHNVRRFKKCAKSVK